jgi:glycosyltransferase involved in cell wall biosynthesis
MPAAGQPWIPTAERQLDCIASVGCYHGSMAAGPSVSVIVPVFNQAAQMPSLLEALAGQTVLPPDREIIVVDNGSSDESPDLLRAARSELPDLRVVVEDAVRGSYAARNRGIDMSRGAVLAFTDADCLPQPSWLERGVAGAKGANADLVAGRIRMTFRGARPNVWEYVDAGGFLDQRLHVEEHGFGATANLFVRREVVRSVGGFRADLRSGGDYEFCHRARAAGASMIYAADAVVDHPARADAAEVFGKTRRVAMGLRDLEREGLLDHNRLTWRHFLPVRHYPTVPGVRPSLGLRLGSVLCLNALKYWGLMWRLS